MRLLITASMLALIASPAFAQPTPKPAELLVVQRDDRIATCNADTMTVTPKGADLTTKTNGTQCPNVISINQTGGIVACNADMVTISSEGKMVVTGVNSKDCTAMNVTSVNQTGGITAGYIGQVDQTSSAPKPK